MREAQAPASQPGMEHLRQGGAGLARGQSGSAVFTIVTPSLNQARYLGRTMESVLTQAGDFEIDYRVMDGGSTDGSVELIRDVAAQVRRGGYPIRCRGVRMEWSSGPDGGQSDAINSGLRQAQGDFAAYLNSDDVYLPGAFAQAVQAFAANPQSDFVYGDGDVIDENGGVQWTWLSRPYNHRLMTSYHFLWNDFTNYILQQAAFWRTRVHSRIGLFDAGFHYAMDVEYWVRAGARGLQLTHWPAKLAAFRLIQGTKSLSGPAVFWSDYLEIFRRYRGAGNLAPFLATYYYQLARFNGFDFQSAREQAEKHFRRWEALGEDELRVIRGQSESAWRTAYFFAASELLRQGDTGRARILADSGIRYPANRMWHPYALYAEAAARAGGRWGGHLERLLQHTARFYRRYFIDYRYHETREQGLA